MVGILCENVLLGMLNYKHFGHFEIDVNYRKYIDFGKIYFKLL